MYEHGLGGPVDIRAAFECSLQSAEAGFPQAQFHLYTMHCEGRAFINEEQRAIAWLQEAAKQNLPEAMLALARLIQRNIIPKKTKTDAEALYEKCLKSTSLWPVASYELAHLMAEKNDDLKILQAAHNLILNCKDRITNCPEYSQMIPGCEKLSNDIWQRINRGLIHAYPQLQLINTSRPQLTTPARFMLETIADRAERRLHVGRNQPCPCGSTRKFKKCCGK